MSALLKLIGSLEKWGWLSLLWYLGFGGCKQDSKRCWTMIRRCYHSQRAYNQAFTFPSEKETSHKNSKESFECPYKVPSKFPERGKTNWSGTEVDLLLRRFPIARMFLFACHDQRQWDTVRAAHSRGCNFLVLNGKPELWSRKISIKDEIKYMAMAKRWTHKSRYCNVLLPLG